MVAVRTEAVAVAFVLSRTGLSLAPDPARSIFVDNAGVEAKEDVLFATTVLGAILCGFFAGNNELLTIDPVRFAVVEVLMDDAAGITDSTIVCRTG